MQLGSQVLEEGGNQKIMKPDERTSKDEILPLCTSLHPLGAEPEQIGLLNFPNFTPTQLGPSTETNADRSFFLKAIDMFDMWLNI